VSKAAIKDLPHNVWHGAGALFALAVVLIPFAGGHPAVFAGGWLASTPVDAAVLLWTLVLGGGVATRRYDRTDETRETQLGVGIAAAALSCVAGSFVGAVAWIALHPINILEPEPNGY